MSIKIIITICCLSCFCYGQTGSHIQVNGRNLTGTCGDTLVLKGVNYAPYNWGYTASENYFDQIALTKANAVRIVWFKNSGSAIYNNLVYLDSALARCVRLKMIPIVELHDATCSGNMNDVTALVPFYTSPAFKALELKYRQHLIINIANEAGYYAWTSNPATALNTYKTTYINAIHTLRNGGLQVPVMIDAPDCGTNSDAFVNAGAEILASDVLSNTLFSVHGYWYGFAGNNPTTMLTKVQALYNSGLCIYFGEIANLQDDASPCQYNLAYVQLLNILKTFNIGWSAWGWYHDVCTQRQLSNNGNANNLSDYGQVIVNDPLVGLKATAIQPLQFNNHCGFSCELTLPKINGPKNACSYIGTNTPVTYTVTPQPNAITYRWTIPANTTLVSATPDSLSVSIRFNTAYPSGSSSQKRIKVKAVSACGTITENYLAIYNTPPATPANLFGPTNTCISMLPNLATYHTSKVANASGYVWTIPPVGAAIISHPAGTGINDTIITVQFNSQFPLIPNPEIDFIGVAAASACGTSLPKKLSLNRLPPSPSGVITGKSDICPEMISSNNPSGTIAVYTTNKIPNASSYQWAFPLSGTTIVSHPAGTGFNDTSVYVLFDAAFPAEGGKISVKGINGCFEGIESTLNIKPILPATPGTILGPADPCSNIVSASDAIYTIRKIPLATSYNWTTFNSSSGGAGSITITGHPGGTGINDTVVTVRFTAGYRTGNIKVESVRNCGTSLQRNLTITTKKVETPMAVNGNATPCPGAIEVYSCPLVSNAQSYKWTVPLNAKILSGQGTSQVTVLYPGTETLFKPGNIGVMAISACGNSDTKSLSIISCSGLITSYRQ